MAGQVFDYDPPDRFVAGTVGQPGSRTFFLQARAGRVLTSVSLEKLQVSALAERVEELLDEVVRRSGGSAPVPAVAPVDRRDDAPLDTPIEDEFRVGTMTLAWDGDRQQVVIECFEALASDAVTDPEEAAEGGAEPDPTGTGGERTLLRVHLSGADARAFAARALAVVGAGRRPCPLCGDPLDVEGHICPRANGYRR
jgi:uncharacterized repeat protein (TIGR03847 family)